MQDFIHNLFSCVKYLFFVIFVLILFAIYVIYDKNTIDVETFTLYNKGRPEHGNSYGPVGYSDLARGIKDTVKNNFSDSESEMNFFKTTVADQILGYPVENNQRFDVFKRTVNADENKTIFHFKSIEEDLKYFNNAANIMYGMDGNNNVL